MGEPTSQLQLKGTSSDCFCAILCSLCSLCSVRSFVPSVPSFCSILCSILCPGLLRLKRDTSGTRSRACASWSGVPATRLGDAHHFSGHSHTMDGRNPAPPKKPWIDDSLVNTEQTMGPRGFKVVRNGVRPSTAVPLGEAGTRPNLWLLRSGSTRRPLDQGAFDPSRRTTVDGRNPFRTTLKPRGPIVCLVSTRESSIQGFLGGAKWISSVGESPCNAWAPPIRRSGARLEAL